MCIARSTLFWPSEVRDTVVARVCVEEAWPHVCSIGWISGVQKREGRQQNPLTASLAGPLNLLVCELFPHFLHLLTAARRHKVRNGHRLQAAPSTRVFHRHTWAPLQKCNLHSYPGSLLTGYSDLIFCPMALGCSMMQQADGHCPAPNPLLAGCKHQQALCTNTQRACKCWHGKHFAQFGAPEDRKMHPK